MEFGMYFTFRAVDQRDWRRVYDETFDQIELAEELGYDGVWLSEHHVVDDGYSPSLLPIAAAIAARTRRMTIGTAVLTAPFHHPVRLAEDAATVDVISGGRLVLGISAGYRPEEFAAYGLRLEDRAAIVDEVLAILKGCWTEDGFSYAGRHYQVRDVTLRPRPVQRPHPPVFYGGKSPAGARRAARVFDEMGRYPAPRLLWLFVHEDEDEAWRLIEPAARYVHESYLSWSRTAADAGVHAPWEPDMRRTFHACTPDGAAALIGDLLAKSDGELRHVMLGMSLPGLAPAAVAASMELFAREVAPRFA